MLDFVDLDQDVPIQPTKSTIKRLDLAVSASGFIEIQTWEIICN
jgi:hypothetical protein